ncbi:MAG: hypothetical protein IGS23_00980 [Rivularia sp. T60_A2020_040]|nr:hypothetical protein [Rivularia sp. T60_A2020_040]
MDKNNRSDRKNDKQAQFTARFGCGFIFGIFLAIALGLAADAPTVAALLGIIFISAVVCGLLSVAFGEKFWYWLLFWL